jgi:hypothetical protein
MVRFFHFGAIFGLIRSRLDPAFRLSELFWIARRTTPVAVALPCSIWPIASLTIPQMRLHH